MTDDDLVSASRHIKFAVRDGMLLAARTARELAASGVCPEKGSDALEMLASMLAEASVE